MFKCLTVALGEGGFCGDAGILGPEAFDGCSGPVFLWNSKRGGDGGTAPLAVGDDLGKVSKLSTAFKWQAVDGAHRGDLRGITGAGHAQGLGGDRLLVHTRALPRHHEAITAAAIKIGHLKLVTTAREGDFAAALDRAVVAVIIHHLLAVDIQA